MRLHLLNAKTTSCVNQIFNDLVLSYDFGTKYKMILKVMNTKCKISTIFYVDNMHDNTNLYFLTK